MWGCNNEIIALKSLFYLDIYKPSTQSSAEPVGVGGAATCGSHKYCVVACVAAWLVIVVVV